MFYNVLLKILPCHHEILQAYDHTVNGWVRLMALKDKEVSGHAKRVAHLTVKLAREHGYKGLALRQVYWGALLHDIGKLAIPDEIINKPGKLNEQEWKVVKAHPVLGGDLVAGIDFLAPAAEIPYHHHERLDGSGYPRGLKAGEIPLIAQVFSIIDVWDSLLSRRPYRPAWSKAQAYDHIASQAGRSFASGLVKAFFQTVRI